LEHRAHFRSLFDQVRQSVAIQHREKGRRGLIQHPSQTAGWENSTRRIGLVHAIYDGLAFLAQADDVADSNLVCWPGKRESTAYPALPKRLQWA